MPILIRMEGEKALWRHTGAPFVRLSAPGPAPSHLVGIAGAALGCTERKPLPKPKRGEKFTRAWGLPSELERFIMNEDLHVAMAWDLADPPTFRRHNVNGWKKTSGEDRARIDQTLVWKPAYRFAFRTASKEGEQRLLASFRNPTFRTYFGTSFCPAFITECTTFEGDAPTTGDGLTWVAQTESIHGSAIPLTRVLLPFHPRHGRLESNGFVDYFPCSSNGLTWFKTWSPTPAHSVS